MPHGHGPSPCYTGAHSANYDGLWRGNLSRVPGSDGLWRGNQDLVAAIGVLHVFTPIPVVYGVVAGHTIKNAYRHSDCVSYKKKFVYGVARLASTVLLLNFCHVRVFCLYDGIQYLLLFLPDNNDPLRSYPVYVVSGDSTRILETS